MTWQDRTGGSIQLTSPTGSVFTALWSRNDRELAKKLGIFEIPRTPGATIQDLDVGADRYPITIFFEGPDHDVEAERFFQACKERGVWAVVHPTKGRLTLQLVSVTERIDPTGNGNITSFPTVWIEPTIAAGSVSTSQLASDVGASISGLNTSAAGQFGDIVKQIKPVDSAAIENTVKKVVTAVNNSLGGIFQASSEINAQVLSIQRGINSTITETVIDTLSLAGQVITLIQLPALVTTNASARVSAYADLIAYTIGIDSSGPTTQEGINITAVKELSLMASVGALAETSISSDLLIRSESIGLIESISGLFADVTDALDVDQDLYTDNPIDIQYFSQSESFSDALEAVTDSARFLLEKTFDLAIEKRIMLTRDSAPIAVTINEYGSLGDNDSNFDLFISSNGLKGNEILLLNAGLEVVVYV